MKKMNLVATGLGLGLALLVLMVGLAAMSAAVLMWGLSLVHADIPSVPALGFWTSFGAEIVLGSIATAIRSVVVSK